MIKRSKDFNPSYQVKKIFFSNNERFCVIITSNVATVLRVDIDRFEAVSQVRLPSKDFTPGFQDDNEQINSGRIGP